MITIYDPYAPGPIAPVAPVGGNIGVNTQNAWKFFRVVYTEGLPPGPQLVQDIGTVAANSVSAQTEITVMEGIEGGLLHGRMTALDDAEFEIAQVRATGKFITNQQRARVTPAMMALDPFCSLSTFFVLGAQKNLWVTAYNNTDYSITKTRLKFWGFRYILDRINPDQERVLVKAILNQAMNNDEKALLKTLRATIVPAEGRLS